MKIVRPIVLAAALAFVPAAAQAQGKPAAKDALLYFVSPKNGQVIKGTFWARFGLRNMGVTHAGDDFPNSGHHHLLIDVTDPLDPNEPIPADKNHMHLGCGTDRGPARPAARQAYAPAGAGRRQALSVQSRRWCPKKSRSRSNNIQIADCEPTSLSGDE